MYRALIVEDDRNIAEMICENAQMWNIESKISEDFHAVMDDFVAYDPHIVLLDIGLPILSGWHWCREIRKVSNVPIVFISSISDNLDIVMAMNMGGDDFIVKPFNMSVLISKILALLRRTYDFQSSNTLLEHRGAILNTGDDTLLYDDQTIQLSKNEYRILYTLMENKGRIVSREKLMEKLWETKEFIDDNTLTVNINRLRKKLSDHGLEAFITTKVGRGYLVE